jgi:hypothetical protein
MKVLIIQLVTNLYWSNDGTWVEDVSLAQDFKASTQALLFANENKLQECQIVMRLGVPAFDVCVTVINSTTSPTIKLPDNP